MATQAEEYERINEERKFVDKFGWMIRPCSLYKTEHKECKSINGRFNQYYMDGKLKDCSQYERDRDDCKRFTVKSDYAAGIRLIESEKQKMKDRLEPHFDNDVWTTRTERPPPNWNSRLPQHLEERNKGSYLEYKAEELHGPFDLTANACAIM